MLERLARHARDPKPAMRDIGQHLAVTTKQRFVTSTAPDGSRWAPNRQVVLARHLAKTKGNYKEKGGLTKRGATRMAAKRPLVGETTQLATKIYYRAGKMFVRVGSPMEYAATQQFGAKKGSFGRNRRGAPIPWGDIPARPFLGLSGGDWSVIRSIMHDFLESQ